MDDLFQPLQSRRIVHHARRSLLRSTLPSTVVPGKRRLDRGRRFAFIEPVHGRIGVETGTPASANSLAVVDFPIPIEPVSPG